MGYNEKAVLHTLLYSDLFDYPLTYDEIWEYLVGSSQNLSITKKALKNLLQRLSSYISQKDSLYCIRGREHIIETRKKRLFFSQIKRKKAEKIARKLSVIPSVLCIGISGACAINNASEEDDIDLFIITKEKTVWVSRLFILSILQLYGVRRSRSHAHQKDTVCVNMLIDEENLYLGKEREDIYSAHEIAQMRLLFDRNDTYNKFLAANRWVKNFLPNAFSRRSTRNKTRKDAENRFSVVQPARQSYTQVFAGGGMVLRFSAVEYIAKFFQLWYMKRHISSETIRDGFLAFHPHDYRIKTLRKFKNVLKQHEKI